MIIGAEMDNDSNIPSDKRDTWMERRSDEVRLTDIQDHVHEIRSDVRGMERRFERAEARVNDVERKVIENAAAQRALEQIMNAENQRLTDRIDQVDRSVERVGSRLEEHAEEQSRDFKSATKLVVGLLLSVLGSIGYIIFVHLMERHP